MDMGYRSGAILKKNAGARVIRQAVEAVQQKILLITYPETHPELKVALDFWGQS